MQFLRGGCLQPSLVNLFKRESYYEKYKYITVFIYVHIIGDPC